MDRRSFVQTGVAAALAAAARSGTAAAQASPAAPSAGRKRKNVLFLFSDQHRECSMPGKPFSPVVAPNLDRFRRENFTMENCISTFPICSPYRGILLSGRWPQQTGVVANGRVLAPSPQALGHAFADAGYHTGYVGKWHVDGNEDHFIPPGPRRMGFEDWHMWADTNNHYHAWTYDQNTGAKIQPEGWSATLMSDDAITFLNKQKGAEKPWFLVVSWNPPHPPFNPPPSDEATYTHPGLETRPNIELTPPGSEPLWPQLASVAKLRHAEQGYYGSITGIDLEVARLLAALDAIGQAEDTIVIYTSDHGEMMGSHGRMSKIAPFEESCRVPYYIRVPGVTKAGGSSAQLFATVDQFPTLCGLAGIPVPSHCVGRDLSGAMTGENPPKPAPAVILMAEPHASSIGRNDFPAYRGLRTERYTYALMKDGRYILYDNITDPFQKNNLVSDPAHKATMDAFDAQLIAWQPTASDTFDIRGAARQISSYAF